MMLGRIRDLREAADLTQEELAKELHVSQATYSRYESGQLDIPIPQLVRLAQYHHTSADYLLGLTDVRKPYPRR